jgi:hypothetical protein
VCGEEKEFQNYIEGSAWGYDMSAEQFSDVNRFSTQGDADAAGSAGLEENE